MQQVFPTKANLMNAKKSLLLAKVGYDLMDRKRNILVREMMSLIDKAKEVQNNIGQAYEKAYRALRKANLSLGDCNRFALAMPVSDDLT
ncbi:MAG: V-type ATP synthase subunit D, partial [Acutalibacteraceae bacterium]